MCQATVYLDEQKIMEDVIWLEPGEDGILVQTFFEEPRFVKGVIKGIDLFKHRVLLASVETNQQPEVRPTGGRR